MMASGSQFPHQFRLSRGTWSLPDGWIHSTVSGWELAAHPDLPVRLLRDPAGADAGLVLGWPIDPAGPFPCGGHLAAPCPVNAARTEKLEEWIYGFGGRFAFVLLGEGLQRFYPDAGSTLGAVYSARRQAVGATVSVLVLDEPAHPVWSQTPGVYPDARHDQYYPAGLTMDPEIRRILPNHYLELSTWESVRQYPTAAAPLEPLPADQVPDAVARIAAVMRWQIEAVVAGSPCVYLPLTAGRDSRMLLACARSVVARVHFVTHDRRSINRPRKNLVDEDIAMRLAQKFHLDHRMVPVPERLPPGVALEYLRRIGFAGGAAKAKDFDWACRQGLDLSGAWLMGFAGEVGRTIQFGLPGDERNPPLDEVELIRRMHLPESREFLQAMAGWLGSLPADAPLPTRLALAYLEHRVGCWAAPHFYGAAPFAMNLVPMCHRTVFDLMLRLPADYRRAGRLPVDLIAQAWPELACLPFNRYPFAKRIWERSKRMWGAGRALVFR